MRLPIWVSGATTPSAHAWRAGLLGHAGRAPDRYALHAMPDAEIPRAFVKRYVGADLYDLHPRHFFGAAFVWAVSETLRETLGRLDMGANSFLPITFYDTDERSVLQGDCYALNLREQARAVVPERTARLVPARPPAAAPLTPERGRQADRQFVLDRRQVPAADLWVDPRIVDVFFISDRLLQIVRASGLMPNVRFYRCRIV